MTKSESAHITAQTVLLESAEQVLQLRSAAGVRLAIPDTNNLIMVGTGEWIAANVPGAGEASERSSNQLHNAIMNLPCDVNKNLLSGAAADMSYKLGHRDARHAAAELSLAATTQASTAQAGIPADWRDRIFNAMDEAFDITQRQGKSHDGALVIDDTQLGVEFAIKQIEGMLGATDAQEAATSSTDAQPPRTKAQIIALANAAGIDTDDEGDIFGSTNGAIFAFVEALGVQAAAEVRDAALEEAAKLCETEVPCSCCFSDDEVALSASVATAIRALRSAGDTGGAQQPPTRCAASRDGDCSHAQCPQKRDNEPATSARHCPLDNHNEED